VDRSRRKNHQHARTRAESLLNCDVLRLDGLEVKLVRPDAGTRFPQILRQAKSEFLRIFAAIADERGGWVDGQDMLGALLQFRSGIRRCLDTRSFESDGSCSRHLVQDDDFTLRCQR
jgi:hypothetical protein